MRPIASEIIGAATVASVFVGLLVIAEIWKRRTHIAPETTRKFVHLFGGLTCAFFPFAFHSHWTVLALAAGLFLIIWTGRRVGFLSSLHGVSRMTCGSEYYPFSIFLLFLITRSQPWLYVSSVLVLAMADAFAAIIGTRYGSLRYEVDESHKSVEGSLAFGVIAFLAIHIPMATMTELSRPTCLLAATLTAALVTGFEAISLRGTDNLFVPIGVAVILSKITTKPASEILYQNASLAAMCLVLGLVSWRSKAFNVGGAITMILFAYGAWSLGSEWWAVPILCGLTVYAMAWFRSGHRKPVKVEMAFRAVAFPLVLLVIGNMFQVADRLYAGFVTMLATVLGLSLWQLIAGRAVPAFRFRLPGAMAVGIMAGIACILPPWLATPDRSMAGLLIPCIAAMAAIVLDETAMRKLPPAAVQDLWPARRMALTILAGGLILMCQAWGWMPPWAP